MLETKDLILDKGRFEDWEAMYRNVWRHPESARYMQWRVTDHPEDAPDRMRRNIQWQKVHDTYFVYLKTTGEAVGFAGVERISPTLWEEGGVCLGPDFVGKGYGRQILQCLLDYARAGGAEEFIAWAWEENTASRALIASLGFTHVATEDRVDDRNGRPYRKLKFRRAL